MHVGAEGARAVGAGNKAGTDQDVAPRGRAQARETERRRSPHEAGAGMLACVAACICAGSAQAPDFRALA
jgi:hypothetical protein